VADTQMRRAFTLIEVLATALIIGTGLLALVAVILFAMARALEAQAACTAMPTAITAAHDPAPLLPDEVAGDWTSAAVDPASSAAASATSQGWMNGYWVVREESSAPEDVLGALAPATTGLGWTVTPGGVRTCRVLVRVYEGGARGREVASFTTRVIRQGR
jgi:hypothetical protein